MNSHSRHLPAEERRAATVRAVLELAAKQNPGEITTQAIARRMDLSQGALFRHFPSKESIWQATMAWVGERLLARVDRAARGLDSPLAAMEAIFMAHIDFIVRHPGVPRMLFSELQRREETPAKQMVQALLSRYGERLRFLVEKGKTCGELAPELEPAAAITLFIGTIQGLVVQALLTGGMERVQAEAPGVFAIYRRGIGRKP